MKTVIIVLVGVAAVVAAQNQTVPRDVPRVVATGTAVINGSVVADDQTHAPMRHATVTLSRGGTEDIRTTQTDEQGHYTYNDLPPGTYTLGAAKGGYISASYGAIQLGMPGSAITIADAERFAAKPIALTRGGVIAGRLSDRSGRPMAGVGFTRVRLSSSTANAGAAAIRSRSAPRRTRTATIASTD